MNTYNGYYNIFKKECWERIRNDEKKNGERWWDKNLIRDDVNDYPIIENKTGVNSSEFAILHEMLCQLLVDYINEHPLNNEVSTYLIKIDLISGEWSAFFSNSEDVPLSKYDENVKIKSYHSVKDNVIIDSYDNLNERIYFFISDFIRRHRENIGVKFTSILFSVDELDDSIKEGKWVSQSDSSLLFYKGDDLIVCSM